MIVDVTTKCPLCGNNFTREMPEECIIFACGLVICPSCDTQEDILIGNNELWTHPDL